MTSYPTVLKTGFQSYSQRRPNASRPRHDRDDSSGGNKPPDINGNSRSDGSGSVPSSRPRGTSDASRSLATNVTPSRHLTRNGKFTDTFGTNVTGK